MLLVALRQDEQLSPCYWAVNQVDCMLPCERLRAAAQSNTESGFYLRRATPGPRSGWCDHLGASSCTMVGSRMVGHESLCLSLNISCSFSWESFWLTAACLSSATFRSCCSFDNCLGNGEQRRLFIGIWRVELQLTIILAINRFVRSRKLW